MNFIRQGLSVLSLQDRFEKSKAKKRDARDAQLMTVFREKAVNELSILWLWSCVDRNRPYLDSKRCCDLGIKQESLVFNDEGLYETPPDPIFFSPRPLSLIRAHPVDLDDPWTKQHVQGKEATGQIFRKFTEILCYMMRMVRLRTCAR